MTDILRLSIFVKDPKEVLQVINNMLTFPSFITVLRLKPRYSKYLSDMIVNFNWQNKCCCEL